VATEVNFKLNPSLLANTAVAGSYYLAVPAGCLQQAGFGTALHITLALTKHAGCIAAAAASAHRVQV
jgi:hypothetical protein